MNDIWWVALIILVPIILEILRAQRRWVLALAGIATSLNGRLEGNVIRWSRGGADLEMECRRGSVELKVRAQGASFTPMKFDREICRENVKSPIVPDALRTRIARNVDILNRLDYTRGCGFETENHQFTIKKPSGLRAEKLLRQFLQFALPVVDAVLVHCQIEGVEFVDKGTKATGECQVCGAALIEDVVACCSCNTQHHSVCWEYVGKCTTFGCGSTKAA